MIGPRVGIRTGARVGPAVGLGADQIGVDGFPSVNRDALSGKYTPANAAQWTTILAGTGMLIPDHLWLLQEASGNFADSIGSLTLNATSISAYQQSETGWSRKFVTTTPQGGGRSASVTGAPLPALSSTSMMSLLLFGRTATVTAERDVSRIGFTGAEGMWANITAGHLFKAIGPTGNTATGATTLSANTIVPVIIQHDVENTVQRVITPSEIITPTFGSAVGPDAGIAFGNCSSPVAGQCPPGEFGYFASWQGGGAERSTTAIRAMLQNLGWTVLW